MLVFKTPLLVTVLLGLFARDSHQTAEVKKPQAADERADLWRLHDGVYYLFSETEGSCAEAEKFCLEKSSTVATITNANKDWIESQADGRNLWMNMIQDDLVTGLSSATVHQCPERQSSSGKRGWVCGRQGKEASYILHRHARDAPKTNPSSSTTVKPGASAASVLSVKTYITTASALLTTALLALF